MKQNPFRTAAAEEPLRTADTMAGDGDTARRAHLFRLDAAPLEVSALGNHVVWASALQHVARREGLDAWVIPPMAAEPDMLWIWSALFPGRVVQEPPDVPHSVSAPGVQDKLRGLGARDVFQCAVVESGFTLEDGELIDLPVLWRSDPNARRAMVYPVEYTDANWYYNQEYWLSTVHQLRRQGYEINLFGVTMNHRDDGGAAQLVSHLVLQGVVDHVFPSTLDGLARCIASSSLAVGSSTGPSWCCLLSDIRQIALERPRSQDKLWSFHRNLERISKDVRIIDGYDLLFPEDRRISVHFEHGLGDCSNFARVLDLYVRHGFNCEVSCTPDKAFLFESVGATVVPQGDQRHPWLHPFVSTEQLHGADADRGWRGNKTGCNLERPPMPKILGRDAAWADLCGHDLNLAELVPQAVQDDVRRRLDTLPRPIVLLHTIGNTCQADKSLKPEEHIPLYRALLDRMDGTVVALDWDERMPVTASYRIRRHRSLLGRLDLPELIALVNEADLVVGVDSGPLHLAGLTRTLRVGIFNPPQYPWAYAVPDRRLLSISPGSLRDWHVHKRIQFNVVEDGEERPTPEGIARWCAEMLRPAIYLDDENRAADVQLRQLLSWCRSDHMGGVSQCVDRHRSFSILLKELGARFDEPFMVETGCIRSSEDWSAGYSTYLFGAYLSRAGGRLVSIDLDPNHCEFARLHAAAFGDAVQVVESKGADWLAANDTPIDALYLDSMDTEYPRHAEECLNELLAALPSLHERSIVLLDDTAHQDEEFVGKGALAVPFLLERGWQILYSGHQTLLSR